MARPIRIQYAGAVYHVMARGNRGHQGAYTQRYNGRHRFFGHPFQGRYKAVLVDGRREENYFQVVSTYMSERLAMGHFTRVSQAISRARSQVR